MELDMDKITQFNHLVRDQNMRFHKLILKDIDNSPILKRNKAEMQMEETTLFHEGVSCGDDYFDILHNFIFMGLSHHRAAPVVRFADGEYAFYSKNLHCNGLYEQAESVSAIEKALPSHILALEVLSQCGKLAPLIHPGNVGANNRRLFSFLRKSKQDDSGMRFLEMLSNLNLKLTHNNYIPFYVVYAYLTSRRFSKTVHGKRLCIVSSEYNLDSVYRWFDRFSSSPKIEFVEIPADYVATRWGLIKDDILNGIPSNTELCLVGAGIGALLVCVDVADKLAIPAIDAGHVLNLMNGREDKSNGPRLYTIQKPKKPVAI